MLAQRRSIRLRDYDYTLNGAYFVTICTHNRLNLFGYIADSEMQLNESGAIVQEEWEQTAVLRPSVSLDAFVIMPNHMHGIIVIAGDNKLDAHPVQITRRATRRVAPTDGNMRPNGPVPGSVGAIIGQFKSVVTKRICHLPDAPEHPIWQRNYYEHIIRNEASLDRLRQYITNNPSCWAEDSLYQNDGR